ncbi:hypothetical protein [Sphingomonas sp. SAFR-052]|uniref:hypothetical protein n=1 Tax=Sphingomonas sp. SAFR-052 TaxID=3436867 RepID=UPI003F812C37
MAQLSKTNEVTVRNARTGRTLVGDTYYAKAISAAFRCASRGQQAALGHIIQEDGTEHLFRAVNGTLVAA